jgi:hypothetical protein
MDAGVDASIDAQVTVDAGADVTPPAPDGSPPATTPEFCQLTGPPVLEATTDAGPMKTCPDQLAQNAFRYALCTCQNYTSTNALITDAFDGSQGPYSASTATPGGSVGVNGDFHPMGMVSVAGSLWASNMQASFTTGIMHVTGDLHVAAAELRPATLVVQGDAWLGGGIQTTGNVTIGGTMHVPATAPTSVTGMLTVGTTDTNTLPYAPACNCDPSKFVDVAGVVRTYEAQNDDVALGIDKNQFANVQMNMTQPLSCGRIFLTSIGGAGSIHLKAMGHVALFVLGDLSVTNFTIDVPAGSDLDLFVGGSITVSGMFQVGDQNNPARARTYVGGTGVNLQNAATFAGNLYAPNANITLGSTAATTLYGSIFTGGSLNATSDLTIHYDKAILTPSLAPTCTIPTSCSSCNDCNGQACNSTTCGHCSDSSQCCAPLVCNPTSGECVASITPR